MVYTTTDAEAAFERWRKLIGMFLAPLVGIVLWFAPLPLPPAAHALAAIFCFTVVLWITEAIPMPVASLLGPVLCVLAGLAPMAKVFGQFAHPIIFLFLGSFLLAEAMQKHGLDRRIALTMLSMKSVTRSPWRLLIAFGLLTAFLSMWMSNTAITAVMLPILLGGLRAHPNLMAHRGLAAGLVLTVAFAASIGGLATPVGTPTNLVALESLEKAGLHRPSFGEWMRMGVPLMLVMLGALFLIMRPRGQCEMGGLGDEFRKQRAALPPMNRGEVMTACVFFLAVGLWLWPGIAEFFGGKGAGGSAWMDEHLPEELIGLGAGVLLFVLPGKPRSADGEPQAVLQWQDTARLDWGTLLLFGGGFCLGMLMKDTGLALAIGKGTAAWMGQPSEGLLIAVAILISIVLSEAASNTASAQIMVPIMISVAAAAGANQERVAIATCLACSLGFMLPISTPPNALAFGTGLVRIPQMVRSGLILDIVGAAAVWCIARWMV